MEPPGSPGDRDSISFIVSVLFAVISLFFLILAGWGLFGGQYKVLKDGLSAMLATGGVATFSLGSAFKKIDVEWRAWSEARRVDLESRTGINLPHDENRGLNNEVKALKATGLALYFLGSALYQWGKSDVPIAWFGSHDEPRQAAYGALMCTIAACVLVAIAARYVAASLRDRDQRRQCRTKLYEQDREFQTSHEIVRKQTGRYQVGPIIGVVDLIIGVLGLVASIYQISKM